MINTALKVLTSTSHSIQGLRAAFRERSFYLELLLGIPLGLYIGLLCDNWIFQCLLTISYFILLAVELINTSIEMLCNRITREYDPEIKKIKDISSAAVFIVMLLNFGILSASLLS